MQQRSTGSIGSRSCGQRVTCSIGSRSYRQRATGSISMRSCGCGSAVRESEAEVGCAGASFVHFEVENLIFKKDVRSLLFEILMRFSRIED